MTENSILSRRDALQSLTLIAAGLGLAPLSSCNHETSQSKEEPSKRLSPFYLPPSEPLQMPTQGINIKPLVRSAQTNVEISCIEFAVAPKQMGPAPHLHDVLDELMFVLEGTATLMVDGKVEEIQAGGWHFRPRKIEHAWWNGSDKPLRFIDFYLNQNFDDALIELFQKIIPDMIKNNQTFADPAIAQRTAKLNKDFGITSFDEKRQPIVEKYGLHP